MQFPVFILCFAAILAFVFADSDAGHFIPKAFYTLDSNGHKSNLHPVNPHTANYLKRLRRQVMSSSMFSSSSSVTGNDGVTHFASETIKSHTPQVHFNSRFGGSDSSLSSGHVVKTTGIIDQTGQVHYQTHEDHF